MDKSIPQVEYGQDIQEMARSADGPFSTRVPNASDTALLYATVPDPSKPIEFKTSLEPDHEPFANRRTRSDEARAFAAEMRAEDQYNLGYRTTTDELNAKLQAALKDNPDLSLPQQRQLVQDLAVAHSEGIRNNVGDRGSGWERLSDPDYDRGQRKALMEFSHQHNHQLSQKIEGNHEQPAERVAQGVRIRP